MLQYISVHFLAGKYILPQIVVDNYDIGTRHGTEIKCTGNYARKQQQVFP